MKRSGGSLGDTSGLDATGMTLGIAISRWNEDVTCRLLDGATERLRELGVAANSVRIAWCPGAFELPLLAKELALSGCDAVVALGCVIRGETDHYLHLANAVAYGLMEATLATGIPIAFGVLTTDSLDQALARSGADDGNKGRECAETAVEQAITIRSIRRGEAG